MSTNYSSSNVKRSIMTKSYNRFLRSSSNVDGSIDSVRELSIVDGQKKEVQSKEEEIIKRNKEDVLIQKVRDTCLSKGRHGIQDLGIMFRHLDIDYNKRISRDEMKEKLKDYGLHLTDRELHDLFRKLDTDDSGGVDFVELMGALRPAMSQKRVDVIDEAFDFLDTGRNGTIDLDTIKGQCLTRLMQRESNFEQRNFHNIIIVSATDMYSTAYCLQGLVADII